MVVNKKLNRAHATIKLKQKATQPSGEIQEYHGGIQEDHSSSESEVSWSLKSEQHSTAQAAQLTSVLEPNTL